MLGTIVNTGAIIVGSTCGSLLKKGINEKYQTVLYDACGLAACGIGINSVVGNMGKSNYPVLFIVSLVIGSLLGTALGLDDKFNNVVNSRSKGNLGQGLSAAIMLFCIGTLSIMGPVMSALHGDNTFLFTNATLDCVTSTVLASTYGIGIILAAPVLFCWQGAIYALTRFVSESFISNELVSELCLVGGFLIACTGISILGIKKFKTLNMLPSLLIPIIFITVKNLVFPG